MKLHAVTRRYYPLEIRAMLRRARRLGFSLRAGSRLERYTLEQLHALVKERKN